MNLAILNTQQDRSAAQQRLQSLRERYAGILAQGLNLDLTRGKPSSAQLSLSDSLDGLLAGNFKAADGTDCRNYGGGLGIPEARSLAAAYLGCTAEETLVGGNSSLQLMYQCLLYANYFGFSGADSWQQEASREKIKFLCPVPGYDRHFAVCEALGIDMIPITMDADGPDMDKVESLVKADPLIKGIWCVPCYSNPGGIVYSDAVVERIARLGAIAGKNFLVMWDNAYAVHHLTDNPPPLANILALARQHRTLDSVIAIGSTSKITWAGAGIAFIASSGRNIQGLLAHLAFSSIGPDKINQLRHVKYLGDLDNIARLMKEHRAILKPKFDLVLDLLDKELGGRQLNGEDFGRWTRPQGGYFILFDTQPGLADKVVKLCGAAGVKLTPAGSTWPYGKDPHNSNIRLAPSFPQLAEIEGAMLVFTVCVEIATLERALEN